MISRRTFLGASLGLLAARQGLTPASAQEAPATPALGTAATTLAAPAAGRRPLSLLILLTDDQGFHLSCLGTPGLQTPNIDRLAAAGVRFDRHYGTCASCAPSRCSLLTGMWPHANGAWRNMAGPVISDPPEAFTPGNLKADSVGVHEDIPTLVEILNAAGYVTGITTKWHLSPAWKFPFAHRLAHNDQIPSFLADCGDRPFFLQANIPAPHRPFRERAGKPDAPRVAPQEAFVPPNLPDTPLMRQDLAEYYSAVQAADATVGEVLAALERAGRRENTLIFSPSDNGQPYHRAKATAYHEGTHLPLVIAGPDVAAGRVSRDLVSQADLMPTMLDLLGQAIPATVQGRSLRPLLSAQPGVWERRILCAEHNAHGPGDIYPSRAATDGRFHYIRNLTPERDYKLPDDLCVEAKPWGNLSYRATVEAREAFPDQYDLLQSTLRRPPEELYDLHTDPYEMRNLIHDARFSAPAEALRQGLDAWMRQTSDPGDPTRIVRRT